MPTGYTSEIEKGISFRQFVLLCARGFGACIMQRDDPMSDLPKMQEVSDYHTKEISESEAKLKEIKAMSDDSILEEARKEYEKEIASIEDGLRKKNELHQKYTDMLTRVEGWVPPSKDHDELKNFMIDQIIKSIEFDCSGNFYETRLREAKQLTVSDWKAKKIHDTLWNLNYHQKEYIKERSRVQSRNEWIKKLYESLPE